MSDLWPASISSHSEKKVRLFVFTTDSQRILKKLLHIVRSTFMGRRENDTSNLSHILKSIHMSQTVLQSSIEISPESCLVVGNPSKITLINGSPSITDQLPEKSTPFEEIGWFYVWWAHMQSVSIPKKLGNFFGVMRMTMTNFLQ